MDAGLIDAKKNEKTNDYIVVEPSYDMFSGNAIDLDNPPRVSFCIPTLNNEDTLDNCLNSIVNQEYPDIEIIIVDNGSTDKTIEIAKRYTDKIYFDYGKLGSVRQTGIEHASGKILGIFDSDIIFPHKKWLINAVKYFNFDDRIGSVWPLNVAPPHSSLNAKLYWNIWKIIIRDRIEKKRGVYGGGNSLFLRTLIEDVGGEDRAIHWGEDFKLAKKIKAHGSKIVFVEDPIYHDTDMGSLKQFTKKQFIGARTFTNTGPQLMNLTLSDVFYEQIILGTKGMVFGLIKDRDAPWLLFPLFISIRIFAYGYIYLLNGIRRLSKICELKHKKIGGANQ